MLDIHPQRTINFWAVNSGQTPEQAKQSYPLPLHNKYESGCLSETKFFEEIRQAWPRETPISESHFWQGWQLLLGEESTAVEILKLLSKSYSIWLLSNTNPRHIKELNEKASFMPLVSGTIYSYEAGCRKPDLEIFEYALKQACISGNEAVFIDDLKINIQAAQKTGMHGIVYKGGDYLTRDLTKLGMGKIFDFSVTGKKKSLI